MTRKTNYFAMYAMKSRRTNRGPSADQGTPAECDDDFERSISHELDSRVGKKEDINGSGRPS